MEQIKRDIYLGHLIERCENGMIKVITGIRRCGKSYLLFRLYCQFLLDSGVDASRIIRSAVPSPDEGTSGTAACLHAFSRPLTGRISCS